MNKNLKTIILGLVLILLGSGIIFIPYELSNHFVGLSAPSVRTCRGRLPVGQTGIYPTRGNGHHKCRSYNLDLTIDSLRKVRVGLFIPAYLRDKEVIIRQNLNAIEQKFDEVIINRLTNLRLGDRYIGLEALARETEALIRGANPMMILEEILQVNLFNSEHPGKLNNEEWQEIADEISFFFDITSEFTDRETKYLGRIRRKLISVAPGESEMTSGHSHRPYLYTGLAPCIAVILYDKNTQLGILMHFKRDQMNIESELENSLQELERNEVNINDLYVEMIGGSIWTTNHREEIRFIIRVYKAIKNQKNITLAKKDILGLRRDRLIALDTRDGVIYTVSRDRKTP